jgi:hypothetical protein
VFAKNFLAQNDAWRTLEVEVCPDKVILFWECQRVGEMTWEQLGRASDRLDRDPERLAAPGPRFSPRGGLGLFGNYTIAYVRRVVVTPLP